MNGAWRNVGTALMIILSLCDVAWTEDSASFAVSCTIPAIPGVNAPLAGEGTTAEQTNYTAQPQEQANTEQTKGPAPTQLQEDSEKMLLADGKASGVIVKTIYSR